MPSMDHSPEEIIRAALLKLGIVNAEDSASWPGFVSLEPDSPDNAVTVYGTEGTDSGRTMNDGKRLVHFGFQVRIRASSFATGWAKVRAIRDGMDESIRNLEVKIGTAWYLIAAVSRTGEPIPLGFAPGSKRRLWTINAKAAIRRIS